MSTSQEEHEELNDGHFFELMDRAGVFAGIFQAHIGDHPVLAADETLREMVERAQQLHEDIYQRAATVHWVRTGAAPPDAL